MYQREEERKGSRVEYRRIVQVEEIRERERVLAQWKRSTHSGRSGHEDLSSLLFLLFFLLSFLLYNYNDLFSPYLMDLRIDNLHVSDLYSLYSLPNPFN